MGKVAEAHEMRAEATRYAAQAMEIVDRAEDAQRDLSDDEYERVKGLTRKANELKLDADELERGWRESVSVDFNGGRAIPGITVLRDSKTGTESIIAAGGPNMPRMTAVHPENEQYNWAGLLRGIRYAKWDGFEADRELYSSQRESVGYEGGYLIPPEYKPQIIDLWRNQSVMVANGAQTLMTSSDHLRIPRLATDPTLSLTAEGDTIATTTMTWDAINCVPVKMAALMEFSNELLEDGDLRMANEITEKSRLAGAVSIDYMGLAHATKGISNRSGICAVTSVGSPGDYDDLCDGLKLLEDANVKPTGIVTNPTVSNTYRKLKQGDGTNAPLTPQVKPDGIAQLPWQTSNQVPSGELYIADWSQALIIVRSDFTVEFSRNAGTSFSTDTTMVRLRWRGDFALRRDTAFCKLSGIS